MKSSVSFLFILSFLFLAGCDLDMGEKGSGTLITESFDVGEFKSVELSGAWNVILREASAPRVLVTTDDNLMSKIEVDTRGNTLEINTKDRVRPSDGNRIEIEYTTLECIDVAGAAKVTSDNVITGRDLSVHMSGAGDLDLDLDLAYLEINVSGAGSVQLSGTADRQEISMSGAGGYDAEDLVSKSCKITISGVGGAKVHATEQLDAQVSGVGGVEYYGNPADVNTNISGMGSIKPADTDRNM